MVTTLVYATVVHVVVLACGPYAVNVIVPKMPFDGAAVPDSVAESEIALPSATPVGGAAVAVVEIVGVFGLTTTSSAASLQTFALADVFGMSPEYDAIQW